MSVADRIAALTPEQRALFERLRERQRETPARQLPPVERVTGPTGAGDWPLTFDQERLWFLGFLDPQSTAYNMITATRLRGELDPAALAGALAEVVRRHGAWRTTFPAVDGRPVQRVAAAGRIALPRVDLAGLPAGRREPAALALAGEEARRPFDLGEGPLVRATMVRLAAREHVCLVSVHHIVSDLVSFQIFWGELAALYAARREGRAAPLPALPVQYADFAVWQREKLLGEALRERLAEWTERLRGFPQVLDLPADRPRPAHESARGGRHAVRLGPDLTGAVRGLARREGATRFMTLLAVAGALFHRLTGQDRIVAGTLHANRLRPEVAPLLGFFLTQLPLPLDLTGDPPFRELLARVRRAALAAFAHPDLPFGKLVEALQPERDLTRMPLVQALFQVIDAQGGEVQVGDLEIEALDVFDGNARYDLMFALFETPDDIAGPLEYNAEVFDAATVARWRDWFLRLAEAAAAQPDLHVSEMPVLGAAARQQLLVEWNDTGLAVERAEPATVVDLFAAQAARTPGAPAWSGEGWVLTYSELDERSNQLARHLRGRGVRREDLVGLFLSRGRELPVALLGVLKAGAGYLPLDLAHPADRRAFVLDDARPAVVLTEERLGADLPPTDIPAVLLDAGWKEIAAEVPEPLADPPGPEDRAYVLYTSGSTGRPKGVEIPHRALANFVQAMRRLYTVGPGDVMPAITTVAFDLSVPELYLPMLGGGTTALLGRDTATDGELLARALDDCRATVLQATPATYRLLLDAGWQGRPELLLLCGAEALGRDLADRLLPLGRGLWNFYGPTETTVWSTAWRVTEDDPIAIGRPIANTRIVLLDRGFAPVPPGAVGELCIGGAGLARGYFRRPGLTAERFIPDPTAGPAAGEPGARLYRTGDLAPYRADGLLEYLGRADHQVKLRGFRIELGEIEAALRRHPAVAEAVVLRREDRPGEARLAAYVGLAPEAAPPAAAELRALLKESLPDYMVPSAFLTLPELPRNANGKVDRRALAELRPEPAAGERKTASAPPQGPDEELLAGFWSELLEVGEVGRGDDFFELGGHSLLATRLALRVRDALGVDLPVRAVFQSPTLAGLAREIARARAADEPASPHALPLRRAGRDRDLPLSFAQQRLWFVDRLAPGNAAYNMPLALRLSGELDLPALAGALAALVRRHETLRTTFREGPDEPVQVIAPPSAPRLPLVDFADLPAEHREAEAVRLATEEAARPFDLEAGPLLRLHLLRLGAGEHALLLDVHHIVSDLWSTGVLVGEVAELYRALRESGSGGRPGASPLPELPVQYADFAVWQREWLRGEALQRQLDFWRRQLAGAPESLDLPTDRPRPVAQSFRGTSLPVALGAEAAADLQGLARQHGATLFMVLLAGFAAWLARLSGQEDVVVGTPIANRVRAELEGVIGPFANTLALRVDLAGDPTFADLVERVRRAALEAYAHQDLPFEKLVVDLQPQRDLGRQPVFQALFALQNVPFGPVEMPGLAVAPLAFRTSTTRFDLGMTLVDSRDGIAGALEYATALFDAATVGRWLDLFRATLAAATAGPGARLSDLPAFGAAARHQVLVEWNDTDLPAPAEGEGATIVELFAAPAARTPDAVAWCGEDGEGAGWTLSYRRLDERSNRLARHLLRQGIGRGHLVGLYLERTLELPVALLGVLKSGAAYLPLDLSHPAERRAFVLADAGAVAVLTVEPLLPGLPENGPRAICLDSEAEEIGRESAAPLPSSPAPEDLAYAIYTSGSTGVPKGVEIPHRALAAFLRAMRQLYDVGEGDAMPAITTVAFDLSVPELYLPMLGGGTTPLLSRETAADGARLGRALDRFRATVLQASPATYRLLLDAGWPGRPELLLLCGAEALHRDLADRLLPLGRGLWNFYGPTETTVWSTAWRVTEEGPISIGRPIAGTRVHLLDRRRAAVPLGSVGEVCIGGEGLARGYLRRPELTADRFVPDPFAAAPGARQADRNGGLGARLYRTGDLARYRADGRLEHLGRADHQVKLRGYRIELGEIEAALRSHPAVAEAVVLRREDRQGDPRLAAYLEVAAGSAAPPAGELRELLRERLPDYMVPATFAPLPALPRNPNGKVDRAALARLPATGAAPSADGGGGAAPGRAPGTPDEVLLAGLWSRVLGVDEVGAEDDFFALGGHSLLAQRVQAAVREAFGVDLPLRAFFERTTVEAQAREIARVRGERAGEGLATAPPIVPRPRSGGPERFPVSFSQLREWILDRIDPGTSAYNIPGGVRARGPLSVPVLAAAVQEIVRRHESLRTTFAQEGGEPVQVMAPRLAVPLPLVDLAALPQGTAEAEGLRLARATLREPFDLARGPLLRIRTLRLPDGEHLVPFTMHHIVSDGWSMGIFFRELAALYAAFEAGQPSPLPTLRVQYGDFAAWQRGWLEGEVVERQLAYWRRHLAGAPPFLTLATDRPRPPVQSFRGGKQPFRLDVPETAALKALARQEGAGPFVVLLAAFQVLLARWSGQEDVTVGTFRASRERAELEDLIGFFVNTLALRGDLAGAPTFRALVRRLRSVAIEAFAHGEVPFERVLDALRLARDPSHTPLFQAMLILQNYPTPEAATGEVTLAPLRLPDDRSNFDLSLWLVEEEEGIAGELEHSAVLFEPATARRLAGQLARLLGAALADPDRPVPELPVWSAAERHQVLVEWSAGEAAPPFVPIHRLVAAQAEGTLDAVAVTAGGEHITYRELAARAENLAGRLRAAGLGPERIAGICLERSAGLIMALLATLQTGAAYLPLDPDWPAGRRAGLLEDAGAAVLLTEQGIEQLLPTPAVGVSPPEDDPAAAEHPAYVLYTSGSTGHPKGVVVRHGSLARYTAAARRAYGLRSSDRVLQFASIGFDTSAEEIYPCLAAGATLVLRPEGRPEEAPRFLSGAARLGITVLDLPTAYWHELAAALDRDPALDLPACVRLVILGGERALPARVHSWRERVGERARLVNTYGPTESTIVVLHGELAPAPADFRWEAEVPLGRPIPGTRTFVLDRGLRPVPLGVYGELCIGGAGLARGYLGRPELTAERFVPDPMGEELGARLYRTGDLARFRPDGQLEFGGRIDLQVKVRGVRIEPGEVEAALAAHPAIAEVAVAARPDDGGVPGVRLVAWFVHHAGSEPTVSDLRAALRERLPEPMIPAAFIPLPALPRLPNGKVDRRALPAPGGDRPRLEAAYAAPESQLERAVAALWQKLLGIERVGLHDNFFDLGGHSLLVVQAQGRLREQLGREIPVVDLFRFPTVHLLARHLGQVDGAGEQAAAAARKVQDLGEQQRTAAERQRERQRQAMAQAAQARRKRP